MNTPVNTKTTSTSDLQKPKSKRGFASMSAERQREIASAGGKAAHALGHAHQWNSETGRQAAFKRKTRATTAALNG